MARLINSQEAKITELPHFTVFLAINDEGGVARGSEFGGMGVVDSEGDSLAAKPVADVVCVAVEEGNAHGIIEDHFEVRDKVRVGEVAGHLEGVRDVVVGLSVVEIDA